MNVGEYYQKQMVSASKSNAAKNIVLPIATKNFVAFWQNAFGLEHWTILCEAISEQQVVDDLDGGTCGHEFVGVYVDRPTRTAYIYHTRPLDEDDIVHELLHVRFPKWNEQKVVHWTDRLVASVDPLDDLRQEVGRL